jgi:hypothetical protein
MFTLKQIINNDKKNTGNTKNTSNFVKKNNLKKKSMEATTIKMSSDT